MKNNLEHIWITLQPRNNNINERRKNEKLQKL